jgi:hypothetical protein
MTDRQTALVAWWAHLQVLHGVPVVLQENDGVGGRQVEAQAANVRRQQHHVNGGVRIESLRAVGKESRKGGGIIRHEHTTWPPAQRVV